MKSSSLVTSALLLLVELLYLWVNVQPWTKKNQRGTSTTVHVLWHVSMAVIIEHGLPDNVNTPVKTLLEIYCNP